MKINLLRISPNEEIDLNGPSIEDLKKYEGDPEDLNYFILSEKQAQLRRFIKSIKNISPGKNPILINPLFSKSEVDFLFSQERIKKSKNKSKRFYSNFSTIDESIDYICEKNKIRREEISDKIISEISSKVEENNSIIKEMYLKDLILKIINPAVSRIFMEDFFTEEEKSKILQKNPHKRGPRKLEFQFYYNRLLGRDENCIFWEDLIKEISFFKIETTEGEIISPASLDISRIPFDRESFYTGYYGDFPGASLLEVDKENKKISILLNEEIFKASSLDLKGPDYYFFISLVKKIISNKISLDINGWKVEISGIKIDSFFKKIRNIRGRSKWKSSDEDHSYNDLESFFINSMFSSNKRYKNSTRTSKIRIKNIKEVIRNTFKPEEREREHEENIIFSINFKEL